MSSIPFSKHLLWNYMIYWDYLSQKKKKRARDVAWEELKTKGRHSMRQQWMELHSSRVWPPDVCLQLKGCSCCLRASSGSHRVPSVIWEGQGERNRGRADNWEMKVPNTRSTVGKDSRYLRWGLRHEIRFHPDVVVVGEWVCSRGEVAVLQSHTAVCSESRSQRECVNHCLHAELSWENWMCITF